MVQTKNVVVFQSDFGLVDGAVSAMFGVAEAVSPDIKLYNLTHEIPQFNIWEASYRLTQTISYWPQGTVFVSVVDPGVGSARKSVVALTESGHYIVTPDNGTLTHISSHIGIASVREIEEAVNRLEGSGKSYTFHGRDVYAFTGARLAAGVIKYEQVGPLLDVSDTEIINHEPASLNEGIIWASIDILDTRYGSLWTNLGETLFRQLGVDYGDYVYVEMSKSNRIVYGNDLKFCKSFSDVNVGASLIYMNSLLNVGIAMNQGNFSKAHRVVSGYEWDIRFSKSER